MRTLITSLVLLPTLFGCAVTNSHFEVTARGQGGTKLTEAVMRAASTLEARCSVPARYGEERKFHVEPSPPQKDESGRARPFPEESVQGKYRTECAALPSTVPPQARR